MSRQRQKSGWTLLLSVLLACAPQSSRESFIQAAVTSRPVMEVQDLYKLLYQARCGIGHLIASRASARDYLLAEIAALPAAGAEAAAGAGENLLESCAPDGKMVRLNLRPFVQRGLDPEKLLDAMLESARLTRPHTAALRADWAAVGALIRSGRLPFAQESYAQFTRKNLSAGFPVMHHSAAYTAAYHPAYRVLRLDAFRRYFPAVTAL